VAELRGQPIEHDTDPELVFDVPAFLPDTFVEDVGVRLDLYRRLSAAAGADDVAAVMDEIRDRFGALPAEAEHLGHVMACKSYGRRLRALALELAGERFTVRLGEHTPIDPAVAADLARRTGGRLKLQPGDRIVARAMGVDSERRLLACQQALAELMTFATQ
jgi:transcription-repair coupling factor (superfamily II helicase)